MTREIIQKLLASLVAAVSKSAAVLGLLMLLAMGSVSAQTYGPEQSICWQNWGDYDRIRVRFEATNRNSDYDSNITVNGVTIASVGRDPWGGNSYSGETYVYKPISISLGWVFVGGPFWGGYNPRINYGCNPTFEDAGIAPIEGTFYFYGSYLVKSTLGISKSATPYNLKAGATGQYYTISVSISNTATTSPTYIDDTLPAGITTSGPITASGGYVYGCPSAGASSLNGCYIPGGSSGTININVPISVANSTASSVTNTAYAYNSTSSNCTTTTSCPGSTTNPVTPNNPSIGLSKALGGSGRVNAADQFALLIKTGGVAGATAASVTTSGTGSSVSGSATLGAAVAGTAYTLTEAGASGANLARYSSTLSCTDSAGVQTGLPSGIAFDPAVGATITPVPGANISCTITNTPKAPTIQVTKVLGGARINNADQFVVPIIDQSGGYVAQTSTTGTGSTVGNAVVSHTGQIGTRYMIGEAMASGSVSQLSQYNYALTCTNALSVANGGTDVSVAGLGYFLGQPANPQGLVAGDAISCTLTNTPKPPTLVLIQVISADSGPGPFTFDYSVDNGWGTAQITNPVSNYPGVYSDRRNLAAAGQDTLITVTLKPGWRIVPADTYCGDGISSTRFGVVGTNTVLIPAAYVTSGASLNCLFSLAMLPPTISVSKSLGGSNRVANTDQFTVQVRDGAGTVVNDATNSTTQGSGNTITANTGVTGVTPLNAGGTYSVRELMAAGSASALSQYTGALSCTNVGANRFNTLLPTALGANFSANLGDVLDCTLTNTPKAPGLSLSKALGGGGRVNGADQFNLLIKTGGVGGNTEANATTTGTGASATGSASLSAATAGTTYTLTETASGGASLAQYSSTLTCTDSAGIQTGLPTAMVFDPLVGATVIPMAGANIACTITNTPKAPALSLGKALGGGGRVNAADQFDLTIRTGGVSGPVVGQATTSGSGLTVTGTANLGSATAGTAYTFTEAGASGANLARYSSTLSCTDSAGVQTGLPSGIAFDPAVGATVTPVPGAAISCTITNTPKAPTVQVTKVLGGTRINNADQFVVPIIDQSGGYVAQTTTTGTGSTVGNAVVRHTGQIGTRYMIGEAMASGSVSPLSQYNYALSCTNALSVANGGTDVSVAGLGYFLGQPANPQGLVAGDAISCTLTNTPFPATLAIKQVISADSGAGPFIFDYSVDNGWGTAQITNPVVGYPGVTSDRRNLAAIGQDTLITVTLKPGWRIIPSDSLCGDANGGATGNGGSNFGVLGTNTLRIPAGNIKNASQLTCTLALGLTSPAIQVSKSLGGSNRVANTDQFTVQVRDGAGTVVNDATNSTTTGSGNTITANTGVTGLTSLNAGATYSIGEIMAAGSASALSQYTGSVSCTNVGANRFNTTVPAVPGTGFTANIGDILHCTLTNTPVPAGGITGVVFADVGRGAGLANDGVLNGAEQPLAGVRLLLTNCAGTVYGQALTDGQGVYRFATPAVAVGAPLCVVQTNLSGQVSTGASVQTSALPSGTPVTVSGVTYTYDRSLDRIAFSWNGTGHADLNFGDVPQASWAPDGSKTAAPGSTVSYAHTFTAGTAGTVVFSITGSVSTPPLSGWSERIYADPSCSGALQPGAALLYPPSGAGIAVTAQQRVCVVVQEFVPAQAQIGHKNTLTVQAAFSYSNASPALSANYTVSDTTLVDNASLNLLKEVRNVTQGGSFGANNQAKSGDVLEYRITYTNTTPSVLSNLTVNDTTPAFTSFVSSSLGGTPASLTACVKTTPANPAPAAPVPCTSSQAAGGSGAVIWRFTGALPGSASGQVLFQVKVD